MINTVIEFIYAIQEVFSTKWGIINKPWFRGESGYEKPLSPKIAKYTDTEENYLVQSFRRQAGGLANVPPRGQTDMWLFMAQHYGVPTRLLDWTEGALHALYFAINRGKPNPRVYMLNSHKLNNFAGIHDPLPNYPLSLFKIGAKYIALAWEHRRISCENLEWLNKYKFDITIPIAFPATYQDHRMIAQRSCFTIHGSDLSPIEDILISKGLDPEDCIVEFNINLEAQKGLLKQLSYLGISAATIFPDLDHLAQDLVSEIK